MGTAVLEEREAAGAGGQAFPGCVLCGEFRRESLGVKPDIPEDRAADSHSGAAFGG